MKRYPKPQPEKESSMLPDMKGQRSTNNKRLPTIKEKAFARHYAKTLNGTASALAVYNIKGDKNIDKQGYKTASAIATENLAKPRVRAEIERLLNDNGIELPQILTVHKRNMEQNEHLPTSQKAVADFYEILGMKTSDKPSNEVKIAFVIEK